MKKYVTITTTRVPRRLRQVRYENQHHMALCKSRKACPHCGHVTTSYYVECMVFGMLLYIKREEFKQLQEEEFQHWPVEVMFEKFHAEGKLLKKGELYFSKRSLEGIIRPEKRTVVSRMENGRIRELFLDEDRFSDLQDILNYRLENFLADIELGA